MSNSPLGYVGMRRAASIAFGAGALAAIGLCVWGAWECSRQALPLGPLLLGAGAGLLACAATLYFQVLLMHKMASNSYRTYDAVMEVVESLRRQNESLRTVAETSSLSDWARRIVFRERDYEFVRDSIHGAIVKQDWDGAEALIRDLSEEIGYADAVAHLREQLAHARRATAEERVKAALTRFDQLCGERKWDLARRESERLRSLFPGDARIAGLPRELDLRRQEHKRRLLKDYDDAVRAHNVDTAHALLLELDHYLTPAEGATLKESARAIFRAKLEQLRAQFSASVSQRDFRQAIETGERLVLEFPNSGYAQEITKMMPVLRQRASQQAEQPLVAAAT